MIGTLAVIGVIGFGSLGFISLTTAGWAIGAYNTFVNAKQDLENQFSNIKTEYQRRADLFYNLVQSVKSYKNFEKETFIKVAMARGGTIHQAQEGKFGNTKELAHASMKGLDGLFQKLMVVFEKYPKLQAIEQHNKLFDEIRITEDRINIGRTDYNAIVNDYNVLIKEFPRNFLANMFGFKSEVYFDNEPGTNASPKINLE